MKNISVVGAGLIRHGLASVFALGGYKVRLHDLSEDALTRAQKLTSKVFRALAEAGLIDLHGSTSTPKARITSTSNLATAAAQADLIIEAVTEDPDIKRSLFSELDTGALEWPFGLATPRREHF